MSLPDGLISYGPDANCTLALCPIDASVFHYQPKLSANVVFLVLFGIALIIHAIQGLKYRTWFFSTVIVCGCLCEVIGYGGRIMLHNDPFSFDGFLMQIITLGIGPAWYTAAIYVTLSRVVLYLGPQYSRFSPKFYYWIFIPCDILSLILQAVGGALSSTSAGTSNTAVDVSIAGLSFQVFTLCIFCGLAIEYWIRYRKGRRTEENAAIYPPRFTIFICAVALSMLLILLRCIYRIDELSDGYMGPLLHDENLFIGLEGVPIIIAVYLLIIGHIGPVFGPLSNTKTDVENGYAEVPKSTQTAQV